MENSQEYEFDKKFIIIYNFFMDKFKQLNKHELCYLSTEVFNFSSNNINKHKFFLEIIKIIYELIRNFNPIHKENDCKKLLKLSNFLQNYLEVVYVKDNIEDEVNNEKINYFDIKENKWFVYTPYDFKYLINQHNIINNSNEIVDTCICEKSDTKKNYYECQYCSDKTHILCSRWDKKILGEYICCSCLLFNWDLFYKPLNTFINPSIVHNEKKYFFYISKELYSKLEKNEGYEIIARCIRVDGYSFTDIHYPQKGNIKINNKIYCDLKPDKENYPKRKDYPLYLSTNFVNQGNNYIVFNFDLNFEEVKMIYVFTILGTNKLKVKDLSEDIMLKNKVNEDQGLLYIKNSFINLNKFSFKLNNYVDDFNEVKNNIKNKVLNNENQYVEEDQEQYLLDKFVISLNCPIGFSLVNLPVRGNNCLHLSFFSLEYFLYSIINQEFRRWNCPICKRPAIHLVFDKYIYNIWNKAKTINNFFGFSLNEISINKEGNYIYKIPKQDKENIKMKKLLELKQIDNIDEKKEQSKEILNNNLDNILDFTDDESININFQDPIKFNNLKILYKTKFLDNTISINNDSINSQNKSKNNFNQLEKEVVNNFEPNLWDKREDFEDNKTVNYSLKSNNEVENNNFDNYVNEKNYESSGNYFVKIQTYRNILKEIYKYHDKDICQEDLLNLKYCKRSTKKRLLINLMRNYSIIYNNKVTKEDTIDHSVIKKYGKIMNLKENLDVDNLYKNISDLLMDTNISNNRIISREIEKVFDKLIGLYSIIDKFCEYNQNEKNLWEKDNIQFLYSLLNKYVFFDKWVE